MPDIQDFDSIDIEEIFWHQLFDPPISATKDVTHSADPNRPPGSFPENGILLHSQIKDRTFSEIVTEFHMTIRPKRKLTPKGSSILLTVSIYEALIEGCDLINYLTINFLLEVNRNFLKGVNVNLDATKKAIALAEAFLLAVAPTEWFSFTDKRKLEDEKAETIANISWFPEVDTISSWSAYYEPEQFLELRIVPIEQIRNHQRDSIPYSGYTKGYSESGKGYSRDGMVYGVGKTPFSPEIDEDRTLMPRDLSSPIDEDPEYKALSAAIHRAKMRNTGKK